MAEVQSWDEALMADPGVGQMLAMDPLLNDMRRDPLMQQLSYDPLSAMFQSDELRAELAGQREFLPSMRSGVSKQGDDENSWQDGVVPTMQPAMPQHATSGMSMG